MSDKNQHLSNKYKETQTIHYDFLIHFLMHHFIQTPSYNNQQ
jgi:hypothetical protein